MTNKTKIQTRSSADRIATSPSLANQRKKQTQTKVSTNLTLYEAYRNHWTNLRRAETKRKKECKSMKKYEIRTLPNTIHKDKLEMD